MGCCGSKTIEKKITRDEDEGEMNSLKSEFVCPITRQEIDCNDIFIFTTGSGHKMRYSADAMVQYIDQTGKLQCPMSRESLGENDLKHLQKSSKRKSNVIKKFLSTWRSITDSSLRNEIFRVFDLLVKNPTDYGLVAHTVSFLLVAKERIGRATYRSMLTRMKKMNALVGRSVEVFASTVDEYMRVIYTLGESSFSVRFEKRPECEAMTHMEALIEEFPLFQICTRQSVSQFIAHRF